MSGKKLGRLTVVKESGRTEGGSVIWICRCECGNKTKVTTSSLNSGNTKSCGCLRKELLRKRMIEKNTKHNTLKYGETAPRLYNIWIHMRQRCFNENNKDYELYGGRGIAICKEWEEYINFKKWAQNNGYKEDLTLDRIDNNGDYCPENCRWVTRKVQANNKNNNHLITYKGETKTISEWSQEINIKPGTLRMRFHRGWSKKRALETPVKNK